jgi:uncharacterized protein YeaC (DUF1315 family)
MPDFDTSLFLSKDSFAVAIEDMVKEGLTYFEAVIAFCEENNKEIEEMTQYMHPVVLDKVKQSARDMGLMPQEPSLEFFQ